MNSQCKTTFLIKVDYTRNASFQGTIHWVEANKITKFRSALEMMMLVQAAQQESEQFDWTSKTNIIEINTCLDE